MSSRGGVFRHVRVYLASFHGEARPAEAGVAGGGQGGSHGLPDMVSRGRRGSQPRAHQRTGRSELQYPTPVGGVQPGVHLAAPLRGWPGGAVVTAGVSLRLLPWQFVQKRGRNKGPSAIILKDPDTASHCDCCGLKVQIPQNSQAEPQPPV